MPKSRKKRKRALRGTSIRERVELPIGIAHPKFRDGLREDAYRLRIVSQR